MRPKDTEWAYLAGIIDGEGTIGVYHGSARVVVAMTTEQPVLWIFETFYVGCYKHREVYEPAIDRVRPRYTWGVYSQEAVWEILNGCLPYLKLKRQKAKEVMPQCVSR